MRTRLLPALIATGYLRSPAMAIHLLGQGAAHAEPSGTAATPLESTLEPGSGYPASGAVRCGGRTEAVGGEHGLLDLRSAAEMTMGPRYEPDSPWSHSYVNLHGGHHRILRPLFLAVDRPGDRTPRQFLFRRL